MKKGDVPSINPPLHPKIITPKNDVIIFELTGHQTMALECSSGLGINTYLVLSIEDDSSYMRYKGPPMYFVELESSQVEMITKFVQRTKAKAECDGWYDDEYGSLDTTIKFNIRQLSADQIEALKSLPVNACDFTRQLSTTDYDNIGKILECEKCARKDRIKMHFDFWSVDGMDTLRIDFRCYHMEAPAD